MHASSEQRVLQNDVITNSLETGTTCTTSEVAIKVENCDSGGEPGVCNTDTEQHHTRSDSEHVASTLDEGQQFDHYVRRRSTTGSSVSDATQESEISLRERADLADGPLLYRLAGDYGKLPSRYPCPCFFCGVLISIVINVSGLLIFPLSVETSFAEFMKTDVNASTLRDTFLYSLKFRNPQRRLEGPFNEAIEGMHIEQDRRLGGANMYKLYDLHVVYEVATGSILHPAHLLSIASFEQRLTSLPAWREFCDRASNATECVRGLSLASFAAPSLDIPSGQVVPSKLNFDKRGSNTLPLSTTLSLVDRFGMRDLLLPKGFDVHGSEDLRFLRSSFRFMAYCCTSDEGPAVVREFQNVWDTKWEDMLKNDLFPLFESPLGLDSINVYYDGSQVTISEVMQALMSDAKLAAASLAFVLIYIMIHSRSILLSIGSVLIIGLSLPMGYTCFAILSGATKMSIASFLALFLVVGLGSDVVFVYHDFWRDSVQVKSTVRGRTAWVYYHAGKASFATTLTTAVSFFANLASVLKPLREFGCFMGLSMLLVWFLLTLLLIPLLVLDDKWCRTPSCCNYQDYAQILQILHPGRQQESMRRRSSVRENVADKFVKRLSNCKRMALFLPVLMILVMFVWAALVVTTDTGIPNIFPPSHNQNRGKEVIQEFCSPKACFQPSFQPPPLHESVCSYHDFGSNSQSNCVVFWCEAQIASEPVPDGNCSCYRHDRGTPCTSSRAAHLRVVSPDVPSSELQAAATGYLDIEASKVSMSRQDIVTTNMAPMVQHEWESGKAMVRSVSDIFVSMTTSGSGSSSCGWDEMCFCGSYVCNLPPAWQRQVDSPALVSTTGDAALPIKPRSLQADFVLKVPLSQRTVVDVIFGIDANPTSPLIGTMDLDASWSFQATFEARQPWAQRNMVNFCDDVRKRTDMRVSDQQCWMETFREYIVNQGGRFPVPATQFHTLAYNFAQNSASSGRPNIDYMWIRDGEIQATFFTFTIDVHKNGNIEDAMRHMEIWDLFVFEFNDKASRFAKGAWHTSQLWVRSQAQSQLISSTIATLCVSIFLAFIGMLLFTRDVVLALFVVASTISTVIALFWFIVGAMQWPVGPIEIIALIVFLGYAVTYSLHIAHKYGSMELHHDPEETVQQIRERRANFSLKSIGGAAVGSAVTTVGVAVFLLTCTLTIFQKLGGVVIAVTVMSIFTALVPLPAALLWIGPAHPGMKCPRPSEIKKAVEAFLRDPRSWTEIAKSGADSVLQSLPTAPKMPAMPKVPGVSAGDPEPPPPPVPKARGSGGTEETKREGESSASGASAVRQSPPGSRASPLETPERSASSTSTRFGLRSAPVENLGGAAPRSDAIQQGPASANATAARGIADGANVVARESSTQRGSGVYEFDYQAPPGALGLQLMQVKDGLEVQEFTRTATGDMPPIHTQGGVNLGDVMIRVNSIPATSVGVVAAELRKPGVRPYLRFRRRVAVPGSSKTVAQVAQETQSATASQQTMFKQSVHPKPDEPDEAVAPSSMHREASLGINHTSGSGGARVKMQENKKPLNAASSILPTAGEGPAAREALRLQGDEHVRRQGALEPIKKRFSEFDFEIADETALHPINIQGEESAEDANNVAASPLGIAGRGVGRSPALGMNASAGKGGRPGSQGIAAPAGKGSSLGNPGRRGGKPGGKY
eukprot:TRINITY_DN7962_c0_g2_i3.p1 TRINITY_DN7962_c0_g2~~TRINITY_DN7962_c0_g2_i3.p1  ORF type:complete len:1685 (+),score=150.09 TRINITY_DN7962_c0_g2_i3:51-5057(+)